LVDGFFHADPHPGNFVILPHKLEVKVSVEDTAGANPSGGTVDIVIGAMDFGMVGYVSRIDRANMVHAYLLASRMDARGMSEMMVRIGAVHTGVDEDDLRRNLERILNRYRGLPIREIQVQQVFEELMQIAFRFRVDLPPDIWLLIKTLSMMDGLVRQLDPDFNIFAVFDPEVRRLAIEQHMPWVWGQTSFPAWGDSPSPSGMFQPSGKNSCARFRKANFLFLYRWVPIKRR
jgi:ubiquinone biosynthesis protein